MSFELAALAAASCGGPGEATLPTRDGVLFDLSDFPCESLEPKQLVRSSQSHHPAYCCLHLLFCHHHSENLSFQTCKILLIVSMQFCSRLSQLLPPSWVYWLHFCLRYYYYYSHFWPRLTRHVSVPCICKCLLTSGPLHWLFPDLHGFCCGCSSLPSNLSIDVTSHKAAPSPSQGSYHSVHYR